MLKAVEETEPPRPPLLQHLSCGLLGRLGGLEQPELLVDLLEDTLADLVVLLQELLGVLAALPEAFVAVGEPGPALLDHLVLYPDVQHASFAGDPLPVHHVELHRLERRGHLVLDDLDPGLVADGVVADLQRPDAPDVEPHAGIELQRPPPRRRLGRAEHDPYLLPQLVDEDGRGPGAVERTRKLPQGLAHEPSLQPHMRVAHLSLDLSPRHEGRHRVDDDDVQGAASDEGIRYLQGLLAVIRLGEVEVLEVHPDSLGVGRVEGVLGVDEGGEPSGLLRLGDDVQGEGRLSARLGAEDLDDATPRDAADAEGEVEGQGAGRDRGDPLALLVAHAHDRTLPELPLYLGDGGVYSLALIQCILQKADVCRLIGIVSRLSILERLLDLTSQKTLNDLFVRLGQNHTISASRLRSVLPVRSRHILSSALTSGPLRNSRASSCCVSSPMAKYASCWRAHGPQKATPRISTSARRGQGLSVLLRTWQGSCFASVKEFSSLPAFRLPL